MQFQNRIVGVLCWLSAFSAPVTGLPSEVGSLSEREAPVRIYRSPEERREAGLGRQITDWLKLSGLVELESVTTRSRFAGGSKVLDSERPLLTLQLGFSIDPVEWLEAELICEVEADGRREKSQVDEASVSIDVDQLGIQFGRLYVPFGEYYSHFVTGPLVEFGETRADAMVVDFSLNEHVELIGYVLDSEVQSLNDNGSFADRDWDWGAGLEIVLAQESIRMGIGYLSDLSESDQEFLVDAGSRYGDRVPAWNAYALIGLDGYETTVELVKSDSAFRELDPEEDAPFAWNIELAVFASNTFEYAFRWEYSEELADEPRWRFGVSGTWRPLKQLSLSLDYLRGEFKQNFAEDDDGNALERREEIVAQISLEF